MSGGRNSVPPHTLAIKNEKKTMKKIYFAPEVEVVNLETEGFLAASIGDIETGGGGEVTPSTGDPTNPDWGNDY